MKEYYYAYNNEAIASCIFLKVLHEVKHMDVARAFLFLPFLLDDRTISALQIRHSDEELDLLRFINQNPKLFVAFNKRYLALMPVGINSLMILSKSNQIEIARVIRITDSAIQDMKDMGNRYMKISQAIPIALRMMEKHETSQLYKLLKIQL